MTVVLLDFAICRPIWRQLCAANMQRMTHTFTGEELYSLVWSEPIQKLAPRYGLSTESLEAVLGTIFLFRFKRSIMKVKVKSNRRRGARGDT
jgi:hypothetical protein